MYVEITYKYLYFTTRRLPEARDNTLWQWDSETIFYGNWNHILHRWRKGYINMKCVIT